jgi:hypothetical protein
LRRARKGDRLRAREVDHDHEGSDLPGGLRRRSGIGDVDAVDVRPPENRRGEIAGEALRADDQDLEH